MEKKIFFETSKNNKEVFICEATMQHMAAHADVNFSDIKEAIKKIDLQGTFFMDTVEMGHTVGKNHCIYVSPKDWDKVQMVQRPHRDGMTPHIQAKPEDTSLLTVGVCLDEDGLWTMFTAFYGPKAPKEPWDKNLKEEERAESEEFWNCHALCM